MTVVPPSEAPQVFCEGFACQRTSGQNGDLTLLRQDQLLAAFNRHQRVLVERCSEGCAVAASVDGQSAAGGYGVLICRADYEGAKSSQLFLQKAGSSITAERPKAVAADQFSKFTAVVSGRPLHRTHFDQSNRNTCGSHLPCRFGTGEASTDHNDG